MITSLILTSRVAQRVMWKGITSSKQHSRHKIDALAINEQVTLSLHFAKIRRK